MRDEILSYWDMCARERGSLQRGMYFRAPPAISVVLMSQRRGAPYEDSLSEDGTTLLRVFRFKMVLSDASERATVAVADRPQTRVIPSWVKQVVFKRGKGRCVLCDATDEIHFDHELPYSKGGTGLSPDNVRILCARHNLTKGARIE